MLARASCRRVVSSMATKVYVRQASYESYGLSQALGTIHSEANYTRPNYATEQARHSAWLKDRKSTRLNSSHMSISYAVFCLKKKKKKKRKNINQNNEQN